jgi:hypothetical protein
MRAIILALAGGLALAASAQAAGLAPPLNPTELHPWNWLPRAVGGAGIALTGRTTGPLGLLALALCFLWARVPKWAHQA